MLVLSRKTGQKLCIGNDIVLTVKKIQGSRVSFGIEAPQAIAVLRQEIVERMATASDTDKVKP